MSKPRLASKQLTFSMFMDGLTIGEIASFTDQTPTEVMEHLSWYSKLGTFKSDFYCDEKNIKSISTYYRDQKIDIILAADDIYEDDEELDEDTKKRWQEEWAIRELSKVMASYGEMFELPLKTEEENLKE